MLKDIQKQIWIFELEELAGRNLRVYSRREGNKELILALDTEAEETFILKEISHYG